MCSSDLQVGRQHLYRHRAIEPRVARSVDLTHPARAEGGLDFVGAESSAGAEGQTAVDYTGGAAARTGLLLINAVVATEPAVLSRRP